MDVLDLLIAAFLHMYSPIESENLWSDSIIVEHQIPLYSSNGTQVAWYIQLQTGAYAIINNNISNPTAIEYGGAPNQLIVEIVENTSDYHIIYDGPMQIHNLASNSLYSVPNTETDTDLYTNFPDLLEEDTQLAQLFSECKSTINKTISNTVIPMNTYTDYGFIFQNNLPSLEYSIKNLPNISGIESSIKWARTSDYDAYANNHCGAVCVTNLAIYFWYNGHPNLLIANDKDITFHSVHCIAIDGPLPQIKHFAKEYFYDCGYVLNYSSCNSASSIKTALNNDRPCSLLLVDSDSSSMHWILAVGYRDSSTNGCYFRIVTGWDYSASYYYRLNVGSSLAANANHQYWVS